MLRTFIIAFLVPALLSASVISYPEAPPGDVVDDCFGTPVPDPYRWLEDVDSEMTIAWVEGQNALWNSFIGDIPARDSIRARLEEVYDYKYISMPYRRGERYFYYVNDGLQEHPSFCTSDSLGGERTVLIDPNRFDDDRTAFAGTSVTDDGSLMAWATSHSGSDWRTIHFMDLSSGLALDDTLRWLKGSVSWDADNEGVYYSIYDIPEEGREFTQQNRNQRIMYHRLGTPQEQDSLVYHRPDRPDWMMYGGLTEDHDYLIIGIYDGNIADRNALFHVDMNSPGREVVELLGDFDATYRMIGNTGNEFYLLTDLDAPHSRVIRINVDSPERDNWVEIVPESDRILSSASLLDSSETLVLKYSWEGYDSVELYDLQGNRAGEVRLPGRGSVWGFGGFQSDTETFYQYSSLLHPGEIYRFDLSSGESTLLWKPSIEVDLSRFREEQVFYESFDGTRIPMFIVYPDDIELDGSNPVILTGYGGFGVSMKPWFNVSRTIWLEMGGVYAIPCLRGGGEYGYEWHSAGIRENRPVVFGDFVAAAEYLIDRGYTSSTKLGISGSSNGGTLIACVLNMRPDLFGAAAPSTGVMDLMRFHLFTVGWAWVSEYGDPESPDDVDFLLEYSPYHNIQAGIEYPPVLISTADHDDRVVPGHSYKYGARLQAAQVGDSPILMSITSRAGHGGAVGLSESLDRTAERYAFFWKTLGMTE